jgi:GNAT superfamily N-acetyltransferase
MRTCWQVMTYAVRPPRGATVVRVGSDESVTGSAEEPESQRPSGPSPDRLSGRPSERPSPLRPYEHRDKAALYDICLRTGDSGGDATVHYAVPTLLGEVYVGPYLAFEPELALVLDDGTGAGGYTLGALDTRAFEDRCEREWWPQLRERHPLGSQAPGSSDAHVVSLIHRPSRAPAVVVAGHPSPLHIDLLPRGQGTGWGRRLIEALLERLADAGSPGVHLGVGTSNPRAVGFYRHLGFTELHAVGDTLFLGRSTR